MKAAFQWDDAFRLDDQLDDEERAVRDAAHDYCQSRLQPRVLMAARHETFDRSIMTEMGERWERKQSEKRLELIRDDTRWLFLSGM